MTIKPGKRYVFNYPRKSTTLPDPDYTAHSGQQVMVIAKVSLEEYDPHWASPEGEPMFKIRADDGWCAFAWQSELSEVPS